jgi:hypothetical protein
MRRTAPLSAILLKYFGEPLVILKLCCGVIPLVRNADPLNIWQSRQWHIPMPASASSASYSTSPQKQLPEIFIFIYLFIDAKIFNAAIFYKTISCFAVGSTTHGIKL